MGVLPDPGLPGVCSAIHALGLGTPKIVPNPCTGKAYLKNHLQLLKMTYLWLTNKKHRENKTETRRMRSKRRGKQGKVLDQRDEGQAGSHSTACASACWEEAN